MTDVTECNGAEYTFSSCSGLYLNQYFAREFAVNIVHVEHALLRF